MKEGEMDRACSTDEEIDRKARRKETTRKT
jgi:hypothetical protein